MEHMGEIEVWWGLAVQSDAPSQRFAPVSNTPHFSRNTHPKPPTPASAPPAAAVCRNVKVWNVSRGLAAPPSLLQTLSGHTGYVASMTLSADSRTLFSAGVRRSHLGGVARVGRSQPDMIGKELRRDRLGFLGDRGWHGSGAPNQT
eukprot:363497-Chlamydomonas_euryale.AAC.1